MDLENCLSTVKSGISKLTDEQFWSDTNIAVELDIPYLIFSSGSLDIHTFCVNQSENIIRVLILSILKGEYVFPETLDALKDLIKDLDVISQNATFFQNDNLKFDIKYFNDNFSLPLKFCIIQYISVIISLNNIVNNDKIEYLLESNSDDELDIYSNAETANSVGKIINLFKHNLVILILENQLGTSPSNYQTLHSISIDLQRTDYDSTLKNILDQKCQFLRYKLVMRRRKENVTVKILRDGNFTEQFIENDTSNPFIIKWQELIKKHYLEEYNNIEYYQSFYTSIKKKPLHELTYEELHKLIKYSKDIKKDYLLLCSYVKEIEIRENNACNEYEEYIFRKNYNYALNNKFSFLIGMENIEIIKIENLYDEIKLFQSAHDINNFFVDFKFLDFIEKQLSSIQYDSLENFIERSQKLIEIGERIIKDYRNNIEWSRENLLYLFHLEYENSTIKIENIPIFISSNFQLPLVPDGYYKEFQKLRKKFNIQKYRYDVYMQIQPEIKKVNELEKKDRRDLERLSLFTAVISFIIGGASGFKFIEDVGTALLFFIVFSTALLTFLITLFSFTRGKTVIKENKKYIYWMYGIFLSALFLFLLSDFVDKKINSRKEIEKLKDRIDRDSLRYSTQPNTFNGDHPVESSSNFKSQKNDSTLRNEEGKAQIKNR